MDLALRRDCIRVCRVIRAQLLPEVAVVFDRAQGSRLVAENKRVYLDFFAGAGTLNYGHNNPILKRALLDYLERDGLIQGPDMFTVAKRAFLAALQDLTLRPRSLPYKIMFSGPSGATASTCC